MANCGEKWTNEEETLLLERLNENMDIKSRYKRIANNMYKK